MTKHLQHPFRGFFIDLDENGEDKPFTFSMEIVVDQEGHLHGEAWDEEFYSHTSRLIPVRGKVGSHQLFFQFQYPCQFDFDDTQGDNLVKVDLSKPGHRVNFKGTWQEKEEAWEGEWEIVEELRMYESEVEKEYYSGFFHLKGPRLVESKEEHSI